jgi:hypothetical protein
MSQPVISEQALTAFKERLKGLIVIHAGWAPGGAPGQSSASKIAKVAILSSDFQPHHIFWLWRENGATAWNLVQWNHWAVMNAQNASWMGMALTGELADLCLRALPVDFVNSYANH